MKDKQAFINLLTSFDTVKAINKECEKLGLSNIRLFKTPEYRTKDDVCFIASAERGENIFVAISAQQLIKDKLDCKVTFITEDMLSSEFAEPVLNSAIAYTVENLEQLKEFSAENLLIDTISGSKNKRTEEKEAAAPSKKQAHKAKQTTFWLASDKLELAPPVALKKPIEPIRIAGNIQKVLKEDHPELWEQLANNVEIVPQVLKELRNLIGKELPSISLSHSKDK